MAPDSGIPLGEWSGSNATRELHESIRGFTEASNQSSRRMTQLTCAIVILTTVTLTAAGVQIILTIAMLRAGGAQIILALS